MRNVDSDRAEIMKMLEDFGPLPEFTKLFCKPKTWFNQEYVWKIQLSSFYLLKMPAVDRKKYD